jgi:preprotein translocase subunit YajC
VNAGFFVLILLVLFLLWLILVRPQSRRRQAQQAMIDHLRVGDEVLTAGGLFATVRAIDEDEVTVELSPGTEARLAKRAIAAVIPLEEGGSEDDEDSLTEAPEPTGQARR